MKYTEASRRVFLDTDTRFPRDIIYSVAEVKRSCALINTELGLLDKGIGEMIATVASEVARGDFDNLVTVDVFQTGSGTGINMNINEVIAEEATRRLGKPVHPNDHVNMSQSSNDVVPTAIRVAAIKGVEEKLLPSLERLINTLKSASARFSEVYKAGRTHLRDAMPVTLGQEMGAFADALEHDLLVLRNILEYVRELPIGGTAVGTGLNAHPEFGRRVVQKLSELTGYRFKQGNTFRAMRLLTDLEALSSSIRVLSTDLLRLVQDLRLMFSGPMTALGEIDIPTQEEVAGSSIMPGKTNPVTLEATLLACSQVVGLDAAVHQTALLGELELSMGVPLMGFNIVNMINLISAAMTKLSEVVIPHIKPDLERCRRYAESSPSLITVLSPVIGYDKASQLGKKIVKGTPLRQSLRELGLSEEEIDKLLDMGRLVRPGIPSKQ